MNCRTMQAVAVGCPSSAHPICYRRRFLMNFDPLTLYCHCRGATVGCVLLARSRLDRFRRQRRGHASSSIRAPGRPPLRDGALVPALATRSVPTGQDPHSGPGRAQFNLGLPKCSLDNGQGHRHAHRLLDLGKPLLIMPSSA
jgi:hypothetical protein